ncbi:hypothetical protein MKI84_01145 [Ancylobacter sp. A5.8]|uniref:hypothetical protein n=1 Tax=Ancylobacter gelatini TaxID=2919920 RepID=UPI001F4EF101|nr:hypothetical protein [Ancylobacter gelatini]MCJ8141518.1 hypothetical protein [Ancylobacter gelatini]
MNIRLISRGALVASALAAASILAAPLAHADKAAGDACAAGLNADGKAIYAAALPSLGSADLRTVVTNTTKSLVEGGKVAMGSARSNAQAAGKCLEAASS